jgi:hypothetical protein
MEQVYDLLQKLIVALVGVGVASLGAYITAKVLDFKRNVADDQWYTVRSIVNVAVYAAEQMKFSDFIDDKLDYAEDIVQSALNKHGIKMDAGVIRACIEAEVLKEFPKNKK